MYIDIYIYIHNIQYRIPHHVPHVPTASDTLCAAMTFCHAPPAPPLGDAGDGSPASPKIWLTDSHTSYNSKYECIGQNNKRQTRLITFTYNILYYNIIYIYNIEREREIEIDRQTDR